jgi:hypothetical protein
MVEEDGGKVVLVVVGEGSWEKEDDGFHDQGIGRNLGNFCGHARP